MGMFDTIIIELHCIWCGTKIKEWQTKDLTNSLEIFNIEELKKMMKNDPDTFREKFPELDQHKWINIMGSCDKCKKLARIQLDLWH